MLTWTGTQEKLWGLGCSVKRWKWNKEDSPLWETESGVPSAAWDVQAYPVPGDYPILTWLGVSHPILAGRVYPSPDQEISNLCWSGGTPVTGPKSLPMGYPRPKCVPQSQMGYPPAWSGWGTSWQDRMGYISPSLARTGWVPPI